MASCGTITVVPAFDPSAVTATCSLGSQEIEVGQTVEVPISITNANQDPASYTVSVSASGAGQATLTGTVPAGSSTQESATLQPSSTGTFNVEIDITAGEA